MPLLALAGASASAHAVIGRILGAGLGALGGLILLTGGILVGLARSRWPGQ